MSDWSKNAIHTLIIIPKGVTTKAKNFQTKNSSKKVRYGNKGNQRCLLALLSKEIDSEFSNFQSKKRGAKFQTKRRNLLKNVEKCLEFSMFV